MSKVDQRRKRSRVKSAGMRVNAYAVLSLAVEEGVRYGWNRGHKHREARYDPEDEEGIKEAIETATLNAICEYFRFDEPS